MSKQATRSLAIAGSTQVLVSERRYLFTGDGDRLLVQAIVCATVIGLIGGLFPAIRAARLPIAAGLRET